MIIPVGFIKGTAAQSSGNTGGGPLDAPFIIIMGQSNAEGISLLTSLPSALTGSQTNHVVWNNAAWQSVSATVNTVDITEQPNASGQGWGVIMNSGAELKVDYSKKIYFIDNFKTGNVISHWDQPSGDKWIQLTGYVQSAFANLRGAGLNPWPLAVAWIQGESDITAGSANTSVYYSKLTTLMGAVRGLDSSLTNIPWINYTFGSNQTGLGDAQAVARTLMNSFFYKTTYDNPTMNWVINADINSYAKFNYVDSVHWDPTSALNAGSLLRNNIIVYPQYNQSSAEATTVINTIQSAGYTMSIYEKGALRDYIAGLKSSGVWNTITARWVFMGTGSTCQGINIKNPGTYNLTPHGSINYDPISGCTPDGSTGYFQTGINPSTNLTAGNVGVGIYALNVINHNNWDFGCYDGTNYFLFAYFVESQETGAVLNGHIADEQISLVDVANLSYAQYDGTHLKFYNNGVLENTFTATTGTLPNAECYLSAYNNNGTPVIGGHQYAMATVNTLMTDAQVLSDYNYTATFLQALNRFRTP